MPRILLTAAVAVAAAVAVPSMAEAATIHQDGRTPQRILLQDAAGETNLVSVAGSQSVLIHDENAPITIEGVPTCMPLDARTVSCAAVRRLELDLGDGPDVAQIDTPVQVSLEGGRGRDRYVAGMGASPSRVDFSGGIGLDTVNYGFATAGVEVTVDEGDAADGRPGDADHIRRDVEVVLGSAFADELTGSDSTWQLSGFDGDDRITGGTDAELLAGGAGNDRIDARDGEADTVECGGDLLDTALVDLGIETSITGCAEVL